MISEELAAAVHRIFEEHPERTTTVNGTAIIPTHAASDVMRQLRAAFPESQLLDPTVEQEFLDFCHNNPGIDCSADLFVNLLQMQAQFASAGGVVDEGRSMGQEADSSGDERAGGRSSSSDSTGTRRHTSRPPSRNDDSGVPQTPRAPTALDSSRRQRATPLQANPPSAYSRRPTAPARRKSDAGSRSDSDSFSPSSYGYRNPRHRTPSNPTSPSQSFADIGSPPFKPPSRPSSRQARPASRQGRLFGDPSDSPDDMDGLTLTSPSAFASSLSSLPMPRRHSNDSDEDDSDPEYDSALGLVMERQHTASTVSMEPEDRVEAMQRVLADMSKKLMETERTLQNNLTQHEIELEEYQGRIDELKSELSAAKKEEKELRSKERSNSSQISNLESEVVKITRQLDAASKNYQNLQKQYQEQCSFSEKYRIELRQRDETIRNLTDSAGLHDIEHGKWEKERQVYEERMMRLEDELAIAQQAHAQLDEQKQENLLLKETIDRMRFDMDDLRNNLSSGINSNGAASAGSSRNNTVSKSLGAELARNLDWGESEESDDQPDIDDLDTGNETVVEEIEGSDEGEDVIHTIIKRRRKVASKANRIETSRTFEEVKEYSDSSTQYEPQLFLVVHSTQTDPPPPSPKRVSVEIATEVIEEPEEPKEERTLGEMEIQTDEVIVTVPEPQPEPSSSQVPVDSPPEYAQIASDENEIQRRIAQELRKLHRGVDFDEADEIVISPALAEDWASMKEELGVGCGVIDEVLRKAKVAQTNDKKEQRRSFYRNIYNTYVYPRGDKDGERRGAGDIITQTAVVAGATALVVGASALVQMALVGSGFGPQYSWGVPGGPTYHDRLAWASFNALPGGGGEGFQGYVGGGGAEMWSFLGRVGGEAARIVRGWPT